jgi:hypothetical protein
MDDSNPLWLGYQQSSANLSSMKRKADNLVKLKSKSSLLVRNRLDGWAVILWLGYQQSSAV